jgi:hypothetical protein
MIYEIAGLRVYIDNKYRYTSRFCENYLSEDQVSAVDMTASATEEKIEAERGLTEGFSDGYLENICIYRDMCLQMPSFNRFLLHAAVLAVDEDGYAFLGRSGAGKSTHTGLWLKHLNGAKIVNGDKPIISFDGEKFVAYGTPWMGKEGRGENSSVVLKGLCFIEQAKENSISKLSASETTMRLFNQILLPTDEVNATKTLELVDQLIACVPAYVLKCDISEEAVKTSFEAMTGKKYNG